MDSGSPVTFAMSGYDQWRSRFRSNSRLLNMSLVFMFFYLVTVMVQFAPKPICPTSRPHKPLTCRYKIVDFTVCQPCSEIVESLCVNNHVSVLFAELLPHPMCVRVVCCSVGNYLLDWTSHVDSPSMISTALLRYQLALRTSSSPFLELCLQRYLKALHSQKCLTASSPCVSLIASMHSIDVEA